MLEVLVLVGADKWAENVKGEEKAGERAREMGERPEKKSR